MLRSVAVADLVVATGEGAAIELVFPGQGVLVAIMLSITSHTLRYEFHPPAVDHATDA